MNEISVMKLYLFNILIIGLLPITSCSNKESKELAHIKTLEKYYNSIIPEDFPKFELNNDQNSIVIWNSPKTDSYIINEDSIFSAPDDDISDIKIVSSENKSVYKFVSTDSIVGYPFVSNDINSRTGREYFQMNIYGIEFYLTDADNSELDYLPVIIHEMAHMTERSTEEEKLQSQNDHISPFALMMYFESDTIFRSQIINENNLLLKALESPENEISDILSRYFMAQKIRKDNAPDSLMSLEPSIEASEGYGRYVEYLCKKDLDSLKLRTMTGIEINVPQYYLHHEKWMNNPAYGNAYMYATGFNKISLLMKYGKTSFLEIYKGKKSTNLDPYLKDMMM